MRSGKGPRATRSEAMADEKRRSDQVAVDKDGETMANEEEELEEAKRFFACYLLTSLSPRHKGRTYIGFTVNPRRRIRQHNGEIRCGAWRTKSGRPWEMTLCIYGFPSNVSALQFEWAWQHPRESLAVRKAASSFKSLSGIANKIKLAYTMLSLPAWESLGLTVNFFSTKYMKHAAGCPKLPKHMRTVFCVMDELPCYVEGSIFEKDNEEDEEEENLIEDSTSMCLDVSGDHVEVDVSSGHDFGTWSKYYDDFRESTALEEEEPCPSESLKATKVSVGNVAGVSNLMATSVVNDLGDADIGTPVVTTEPYFLIESPEHVQEDSRTTSSGITQLSSSEDTFDFLKQTNLENLSHQSTPTSSSKKAPSGRLFRSPENNVINLVSPPDFLIRPSRNKRKKSPHHLDIIDLTDSPVSL